jgi:broad specificity phosphatase PhoE
VTEHQVTTLLLIRHGQTDHNAAGRWQGHLDVPLNENGQAQAQALAQRLADWPIEAVYSSDLQRAMQTAVAIATPHTLQPTFDPIWRERDVGAFQSLNSQEIQTKFPAVWADMLKTGVLNPPNGEHQTSLRERAERALAQVLSQHEGQMIAIVSHGALLNGLISNVLGIPRERFGRFRLNGNTGLSIVENNSRGPVLTLLNDTSHLP